jgi:glycosyltransferase involved in cell wall biosynthesis
MAALFPKAEVSMIVNAPETLTPVMRARVIRTSPLQAVAPRWVDHRCLLPLFPWAVRRMRIPPETRLLLTSDSAVIKGLPKPEGCLQVCYCHSPPRYLWDMSEDYARQTSGLGRIGRWAFRRAVAAVRRYDRAAAVNVDYFIANSRFVAGRIERCYGREARVIYPAVDVAKFRPTGVPPEEFYLIVSELVAYKRVDLAVTACSRLGRRLVVVGDGAEMKNLRRIAGPSVEFRGRVDDAEVAGLMARCRAFLHPQIEDFGLTAVEVQAAGRPVIAFGEGGALETVLVGETGVFFAAQTVESLVAAMQGFERMPVGFSTENCRKNAERFSLERFHGELTAALQEWVPEVMATAGR